MNFNIKGRVTNVLEITSGTSKTGNEWKKQAFVIETEGQYPKKVHFDVWGDRLDQLSGVANGAEVEVEFRVESREYNGRWYTNCTASNIRTLDGAAAAQGAPSDVPPPAVPDNVDEDDMPF
jgi:hypothetical protein